MTDLELREAIAVEVMKTFAPCPADSRWHVAIGTIEDVRYYHFATEAEAEMYAESVNYGRAIVHEGRAGVPAYESDIAAAWLVVEKMREDDWENVIIEFGTDDDEWEACFCWPEPFGPSCKRTGKIAPEAICRAALAAVRDVT